MAAVQNLLPLVLIFVIMYVLLIRPQQKKAREHKAMITALRRGDQVVTQGGILGRVTKVMEEGMIEVEIADNIRVKVVQATVAQVMSKTEPARATPPAKS